MMRIYRENHMGHTHTLYGSALQIVESVPVKVRGGRLVVSKDI
jgi:hypothetical protein